MEPGNGSADGGDVNNATEDEEELEPGSGSADGGDVNNATEEDESDYDAEEGLIPGFGSVLGISALFGAAFYRRKQN